ncbi:hypothetical protein ACFE04_002533 [Oxalis oulophora]
MGLSTKQVSGEGVLDWNQTLLQAQNLELPKPPMKRQQSNLMNQSEPLNCPRCDSSNTKFCYYNNYNKSQPRYFCKACKRHWTKGGTLRNVPVGGGRKNKRHKTSTIAAATTNTRVVGGAGAGGGNNQNPRQSSNSSRSSFLFGDHDQSLLLESSKNFMDSKSLGSSESSVFNIGSSFSLPQTQTQSLLPFSFTSSSSSAFQAGSNVYGYNGQTVGDPILKTTTFMPSSSCTVTPVNFAECLSNSWQMPNTSSGMETANYWNWDDLENLVSSSSTDINIPWEDPDGGK